MSFSNEVKNELSSVNPQNKSRAMAEISALLSDNVPKKNEKDKAYLVYRDENYLLVKKVFTFFKKYYNISFDVFSQTMRKHGRMKTVYGIKTSGISAEALNSLKREKKSGNGDSFSWLRGMFLKYGSINDPSRSYHMEFVLKRKESAEQVLSVIKKLGFSAGFTERKGACLVYIKDGSVISDMLAGMGASLAMLCFENERAMKETRGVINRRVNCEIGNLKKSTEAGLKQLEDIRLIEEKMGITNLPDGLREIAELRMDNPEASLQELGNMIDPPLGRSGVNHRLQKLSGIAQNLRVPQEECNGNQGS